MSYILDNLFLGDAEDAHNIKFLQQNQISHILIVAAECEPSYPKSFIYMHVKAEDSESFQLIKYFDMMADFIHFAMKKGGCVFVHCAMGVSRSPTAIIAYLIKHRKFSFSKAHKLVGEKRFISPNEGFIAQLKEYEKSVNEKSHPWRKNSKPLVLQKPVKKY